MSAPIDAGFSLLEVLIGLAIMAFLSAVAAAAVVPVAVSTDVKHDIRRFVADAKSEAILRGSTGLLVASGGVLSYGPRQLSLGSEAGGAARLLVYSDGTLGGDGAQFSRVVGTQIAGVFR